MPIVYRLHQYFPNYAPWHIGPPRDGSMDTEEKYT